MTQSMLFTDGEGRLKARTWSFHLTRGPDAGRNLTREFGTVLIGTDANNDLVLTDPTISRYHLELSLHPEGVQVTDLESKNGTRIGSARIQSAFLLGGGSIEIGDSLLTIAPAESEISRPRPSLDRFGAFQTRSPPTQTMLGELDIAAQSAATILFQGETGTGKELLAAGVHERSQRAGALMVVDCSTLQGELLESQLFGHVKGAFTGATSDREGAFEAADGGTVFLDELGELPLTLQPKLLRVLESRAVIRVGENHPRKVDFRLVAATNRDLEAMCKEGTFRRDLFFRVAVVRIRIPPLRDRLEDVALLANVLLSKFGREGQMLSDRARRALEIYDWPGNVRELRNVIERATALNDRAVLDLADLLPGAVEADSQNYHAAKDQVIVEFERRYVRSLLARYGENLTEAAKNAGLSRSSLYELIRRADLEATSRKSQ